VKEEEMERRGDEEKAGGSFTRSVSPHLLISSSPLLENIDAAYEYCRRVTRRHAKSFYFSARFLPPDKRRAIYAVYALCRHIDDEVDAVEGDNPAAAQAAVEQWRNKLNEVYSHTSEQSAIQTPQSAILRAWRDLLTRYPIPPEHPLELMRGVLMDTYQNRYATWDELKIYCYRVASVVGLMSSEIFGYEGGAETLEYAKALGYAMQLTNILRDVGEDAQMNRIYLPQEDLARFNYTEDELLRGLVNDNFVALMRFEIARARALYAEADLGLPRLHRDARLPVLSASRLYARILARIERNGYDVFTRRAHTSTIEKLLALPRLWRAARRL
jgi:phytoene synthase